MPHDNTPAGRGQENQRTLTNPAAELLGHEPSHTIKNSVSKVWI